MRILITGGAGCLGSQMAVHLGQLGATVFAGDNFLTGREEWIPKNSGIELLELDVRDEASVNGLVEKVAPDVILHAAASYNNPQDYALDLSTNALGTRNVAAAAEQSRVTKLIYFQTMLAYGESANRAKTEEDVLAPAGSYAISKVAGEHYALAARVPSRISLRLANVTAPRLSIGPFPAFFRNITRGEVSRISDTERDFLSFGDFFALLRKILDSDPDGPQVYNVGSGKQVKISELFGEMARVMKAKAHSSTEPIPDTDVRAVRLDSSKVRQAFDWAPQDSFSDVVRQQVEWFQSFGVGELHSHIEIPSKGGQGER